MLACYCGCCSRNFCFFLLHIACYGNWGNEQQSNVEESIEKPSICARSSSTIPRIHMILTLHSQGCKQWAVWPRKTHCSDMLSFPT
jgi:hypothetical protein